MTDAITFSAASPRLGLPLLYAGQAQKEAFVNESCARLDAAVHCAIEGIAATPPATPVEGSSWLVATPASGDWAGQDGCIAARQAGNWLFLLPFDGLRIFNRASQQFSHYDGGWKMAPVVSLPQNGTMIDNEARSTLANLVAALQTAGILPRS
ncbi:DUF2793 domain-containing protein [Novosphingobium terrae]|uniref:DUF2793 domain-containing protein n=1 Tax=Novosphingobium terrae TaxID=2726189 RepID=UPI00197F848A|nr:DUF2793 domain-containing protein [Novosphingobium terrae]